MGMCVQKMQTIKGKLKNKITADPNAGLDLPAGDVDPNQFPFNPSTDFMFHQCEAWYSSQSYVDLSHFKLIKVIGVGTHSIIWLVEKRKTEAEIKRELQLLRDNNQDAVVQKDYHTMKVMNKKMLFQTRSVECAKSEMRVLRRIIHPFVLNLNYAFHDVNNCYLVTEYLKGGDLEYHFKRGVNFTEKQA